MVAPEDIDVAGHVHWATVVPWRKAAAIPLTASQSDGIPTASPPSTDSAASAAVSLVSALVTDYSSASMNRPDWDAGYHLVVSLVVESLASPYQWRSRSRLRRPGFRR